MVSNEAAEKEHEPTQHKLDEARKKGDLVKSADLTVAAVYAGFLIAAIVFGQASLSAFANTASYLLSRADGVAGRTAVFDSAMLGAWVGELAIFAAPWFLLPMGAAVAALAAQRAVVFAPDKLLPKLNRIDPVKNAGQKFGRNGLFEFVKSFVKLVLIAVLLGNFLISRMPRILISQGYDPGIVAAELAALIQEFMVLVVVLALAFGIIDYFWQRLEHLRRNRMSRQELVDEMKNSEGDPHMKAQRRQRGMEIATNSMLADVPKADVVVVNPTHYAVALKWERGRGRAPYCVAKGVDEIAARIRGIAMENGVPIHSDPPTARALHATIDIGDEIRPEHYKAIAAAIRFAERMRHKARGGWS